MVKNMDKILKKIVGILRKQIDITTLKYMMVGTINMIIGTSVMFVLYNVFSVNYWISSASNYIGGGISSFFLNKYFTFRNYDKSLKQLLCFITNLVVCYVIAYGIARPVVVFLLRGAAEKTQGNISMLAGMIIFMFLNYFGQRLIVFRQK